MWLKNVMHRHEGHFTHTRLRVRDHYTSSTLTGGKGGASPSSLHATLEGTNGVCKCTRDEKSTWIST